MFSRNRNALLSIIIIGYFAYTAAYRHTNDGKERFVLGDFTDFAPVKWDGICPKRDLKCPSSFQGTPPLLLVSLDGFRPDYMNRRFTPTIQNIAKCGSSAKFMYPVFPTKTFPNHFSQVTGLNPPTHGIIDNSMYDPIKAKLFKVGQPETYQSFWWKKEPIWVSAEKQGKRTACFFWPGSDIKINGTTPTFFKKYNAKISYEARVNQVLEWLDLPSESRPKFLTLYVNEPDHSAHHHGINSKETNEALAKVDNMISRLFSGLQQRNLVGCVNVVIVSDHGMSDTDCSRVIEIQKYVNVSAAFTTMGPFGRIRPKGRRNDIIVKDMISKLKCRSDHMRVYAKEQLPVRMHYSDSRRIEPIFLDLDAGWTVVSRNSKPGDSICSGGAHGYDNLFPDMRAIFVAHGPSFKRNMTIRPFINTELYEMFTELINIVPKPNNGTKGSLHHILTSPDTLLAQIEPDPPALAEVAKDEMEYNFRVYAANCTCTQTKKQVDIEDINGKHMVHLPFGVPYSSQDNKTLRLLYNDDYIAAFDLKYRLPMWTSFTLTGSRIIDKLDEVCWKGDARIYISDTSQCGDYNTRKVKDRYIIQRPLYPPGFSDSSTAEQTSYVTNSIPKSLNHTNILEKKLNEILSKWAAENGQLNVMMGPAFDLDATGVRPHVGQIMRLHENNGPLVVPTHIYAIATWCSAKTDSLKTCDPSKLEVHSFLLPNEPYTHNCESPTKVIRKNAARVVDIENLTGISFFTGLPIYDAIRLRTLIPDRTI